MDYPNLRRKYIVTVLGGDNSVLRTFRFSTLARALVVMDALFDAGFGVGLDVN